MDLKGVDDLFELAPGDTVSKASLNALIQYSKVEASPFWSGSAYVIGNTPQQGINWVGVTAWFARRNHHDTAGVLRARRVV